MDGTSSLQWAHILESLIGTFAGALVALCSMWIKERIDRRKAVQDWFEQYYITEGLDPVLHYLSLSQHFMLMNPRSMENKESLKGFLGDPPLQALQRVGDLVQRGKLAGTLGALVFSLAGVRPGEREFTIYHLPAVNNVILDLLVNLDSLRRHLIGVRVKRKGDIYRLYEKNRRLAASLAIVTEDIDATMTRYAAGMQKAWEEAAAKETSEQLETKVEGTHNNEAT
jgi:hypothetical protein